VRPTEHASLLRPVGIGVGLLGLAAVGVGTYFGVRAIGKWNDSNAACPGTTCTDPAGVTLASDAQSAARVADVTLAAGAVGVVAGVLLYLAGAPAAVQVRGSTGELAVAF
jgi:serine/threonine-protein kinase